VHLNGQQYPHRPGLTLRGLLTDLAIEPHKVVVMREDEIYRGNDVPEAPVGEDDVIEIVTMMQGG
jgi:thiamine biosynthesis protein ThiS